MDIEDIFGNILTHKIGDNKYVVNLYGQILRGSPRKYPPVHKIKIVNKNNKNNDLISVDDTYFQEKSYEDSLVNRMEALKLCLMKLYDFSMNSIINNEEIIIGMPLIASGLASDKNLKGGMSDFNYFSEYILPIVENNLYGLEVKIYYI